MKIQELRRSGQIVEAKKNHEIPFGVRAIQSGIQVDGIWISKANTPAVSELKLGSGGTSPDMLPSPDPKNGTITDIRPLTNQATHRQYLTEEDVLQRFDNTYAFPERSEKPQVQGAYKPRRASHPKQHGVHGEFDETTLHHLEGTSAQKKVHVHRPRHNSSRHAEVEGESSAADNELSSSVSSRSDASLSQNMHSGMDQDESPLKPSAVISATEVQSPANVQSSRAEYFSVPGDSPSTEAVNPFQTPYASPTFSATPLVAFDNSEEYRLQQSQAEAPFVAGQLHMNKSVRKVNSGFEVLPAGTFGVPTELKGKGLESDLEAEDSGERRQSKLQKKQRTSMPSRRTSRDLERQ